MNKGKAAINYKREETGEVFTRFLQAGFGGKPTVNCPGFSASNTICNLNKRAAIANAYLQKQRDA